MLWSSHQRNIVRRAPATWRATIGEGTDGLAPFGRCAAIRASKLLLKTVSATRKNASSFRDRASAR